MKTSFVHWQRVKAWKEGSDPEYFIRSTAVMAGNFKETLEERSRGKTKLIKQNIKRNKNMKNIQSRFLNIIPS